MPCLFCGRHFLSVNHMHLSTHRQLDPNNPSEDYKRRFGVPHVLSDRTRKKLRAANIRRYIAMGRAWSKRRVILEIRRRAAEGKPLNHGALEKRRGTGQLLREACTRFGSWPKALRAAGIDPARVALRRRFDRGQVLSGLRARALARKDMRYPPARRDDPRLVSGAEVLFGGWRKALREAGLDPVTLRLREEWTRARVTSEIRRRRRADLSLAMADVEKDNGPLVATATRLFGSWRDAVERAGYDYSRIRQTRTWTRADVLDAIRARAAQRRPLNPTAVKREVRGLVYAARDRFGSWEAAVRAARVGPVAASLRKRWTPDGITREIRRRYKAGESIGAMAGTGIPKAAARHFGSLRDAVRAAGVSPDRMLRRRSAGTVA